MQIVARELPLEGTGDRLIVVLEAEDARGCGVSGREVGRRQGFALEDREVDLDLVEPARVLGQVHEDAGSGSEPWSRSTARWPRWMVPPSTIQKTRRAER